MRELIEANARIIWISLGGARINWNYVRELFEFDSMYKIWYKFLFLVEIKNKQKIHFLQPIARAHRFN